MFNVENLHKSKESKESPVMITVNIWFISFQTLQKRGKCISHYIVLNILSSIYEHFPHINKYTLIFSRLTVD